jgi:hypothetical protein
VLFENLKEPPLALNKPQKTIGAMPCPIGIFTDLWLLANPFTVHDIGETDRKTT